MKTNCIIQIHHSSFHYHHTDHHFHKNHLHLLHQSSLGKSSYSRLSGSIRMMSSACCSGNSTSLIHTSCCKGGSSPSTIQPCGIILIADNQVVADSMSRVYEIKLTFSSCKPNMKGFNVLYLRSELASTTPNLLNQTSLLTTKSNHSHLKMTNVSFSNPENYTSIISCKIPYKHVSSFKHIP